MPLQFTRRPSPFKGMDIFGAIKGNWTFVVSEDREHEPGVYWASVKPVGTIPFDNNRSDLGSFPSFSQAERACNDFYRKRNN